MMVESPTHGKSQRRIPVWSILLMVSLHVHSFPYLFETKEIPHSSVKHQDGGMTELKFCYIICRYVYRSETMLHEVLNKSIEVDPIYCSLV